MFWLINLFINEPFCSAPDMQVDTDGAFCLYFAFLVRWLLEAYGCSHGRNTKVTVPH